MNNEVLKVFTGLIRAWQLQGGQALPDVPEEFFEMIDEKYVPLIDSLFFAKEPE